MQFENETFRRKPYHPPADDLHGICTKKNILSQVGSVLDTSNPEQQCV